MRFLPLSLLGLVTTCGGDPPREAPMHLFLDTETQESGCQSEQCEDYGMSCGGTLLLRATDPDTGRVISRRTGEPLTKCLTLPPSSNLCKLSSYLDELTLFGLPATAVRLEVAIWNPDDVAAGCPDPERFELFDTFGRPQVNFRPQPAFAGAAYFPAQSVSEATLALSCPNPDSLTLSTCLANQRTDVVAAVTDVSNMLRLNKEQAERVSVAIGEPRTSLDELGNSFTVLDAADTWSLPLDTLGAEAIYSASLQHRFADTICAVVLEDAVQTTPTATCEVIPPQVGRIDISPVLIRKDLVNSILGALGTSVPDAGLVIGRVVDESLQPQPDVQVVPSAGTVQYLSEDLTELTGTRTSPSGYFVALDTPFETTWTGTHPDGRRQRVTPHGGLIRGKLTAVVLRMANNVVTE